MSQSQAGTAPPRDGTNVTVTQKVVQLMGVGQGHLDLIIESTSLKNPATRKQEKLARPSLLENL